MKLSRMGRVGVVLFGTATGVGIWAINSLIFWIGWALLHGLLRWLDLGIDVTLISFPFAASVALGFTEIHCALAFTRRNQRQTIAASTEQIMAELLQNRH